LTVAVGFLYIIGRTFVLRVRGSHRFTRAQRLIAAGLVAFCVIIAFQMVYYRGLSPIPWSRYAINVYPLALTLLLTAAIFDEMMRTMAIARRRAGLARAKTQALEFTSALRADMVRELSHEMHTPLAVIVGFSQLAAAQAREEHMSAQITADVEAVAEEAKRLSAIVDRITLVPMADAGPLDAATRDISLADAVLHATRLYEMVIRRSGSRLETHIEPDLPLVRANLGGLTQVLFNLLTNAHKHAQADVIAVTARALPDGEVEVTVTDNGSGIRPEFLPTAFDRYAKDGQSGQGIGLAVARSIVEGFGGRIWLDSEVGVGTTAGFALPAIGE
jgi:signal transduction histidine kinase